MQQLGNVRALLEMVGYIGRWIKTSTAWNRAGRRTNNHQTSLFAIIGGGGGGVIVVAGNTITEAVVFCTDRPICTFLQWLLNLTSIYIYIYPHRINSNL